MSIVVSGRHTVSCTVGGRQVQLETGHLAKQADGAIVVRSGDAMVRATAQGRLEGREGADFFPLTVDVEERMYAAGKIPGGFFKREGRPTERAILNARMIDRPIRPLWPKGFKNEVQLIATILSADQIVAHDVLAINGCSAALMVSSLPFLGPVGAVRIGMDGDSRLVVDPTLPELQESRLDLLVVGTRDAITMVECGAEEVPEDVVLAALALAHREIQGLCEAQEELRRLAGKAKLPDPEVTADLDTRYAGRIHERIAAEGLKEGQGAVEELEAELSPAVSMSSTEEDVRRRMQIKAGLSQVLERVRVEAVSGPVRSQFESDLR